MVNKKLNPKLIQPHGMRSFAFSLLKKYQDMPILPKSMKLKDGEFITATFDPKTLQIENHLILQLDICNDTTNDEVMYEIINNYKIRPRDHIFMEKIFLVPNDLSISISCGS